MENKTKIYSLVEETHQFSGLYFEIIKFKDKYHLYYFSMRQNICLLISETLDFKKCKPIITINQAPGGVFCIINEDNYLYMLCGCHISNKEPNEIPIPDLVWPKNKRTLLDWKKPRTDRKNGMYLLKSNDGIYWEQISTEPVLHSYIKSPTCKLGECCFDTHPCLIKWKNEYIFFGRLNSSLDERRVYIRKSKDLLEWSLPEKINIINEHKGNFNNNYYSFVVYEKDNILSAFSPYFEACGTTKRQVFNGEKTLYLKSKDGLNWEIIDHYLHTNMRYQFKINSVLIENNNIKLFFRENCLSKNQNLIMFDFNPNTGKKIDIKKKNVKNIIQLNTEIYYKINNKWEKGTVRNINDDKHFWIVLENGLEIKDAHIRDIKY